MTQNQSTVPWRSQTLDGSPSWSLLIFFHCTFSFSVSLVFYLNLSLDIISIFPRAKI